MIWTEEADALLRELHADKSLSFEVISERMNAAGFSTTKNSCIGRSHRSKLYRAPPRPYRQRRKKPKRSPRSHTTEVVMTPQVDEEKEIICEVRNRTGLLIDFDHEQCRWPLEEISHATYRYCTEDKAHLGSSYCAKHHRIAHPQHRG